MGKTTRIYETPDGKKPYNEWIASIRKKNHKTYLRIRRRVNRLIYLEDFGDRKYLGDGVYEIRFYFGPGYRIYFAEEDGILVILLCGGDKSTQQKDILKAKAYWREYRERNQ